MTEGPNGLANLSSVFYSTMFNEISNPDWTNKEGILKTV